MKKLMVALAAVATAFGLYAADSGFISGAGFDTTGETQDRYSYDYNASGEKFSSLFWTVTEGLTWTAGATKTGEDVVPNEFAKAVNDGYMAVKTTLGNPVFQKVNVDGMQKIGNDLFFDGLVKFTAFDYSDEPTAANAKLAVYLKLNEAETETNLFVRAIKDGVPHDYQVAVADGIAADAWYRLTIKAIADIDGAGKVAFMVFVDNKAVSSTDARITSGLKPEYNQWGADGELFVSLGGDDDEIEGIGFDGQGAIDDIVFTTEVPFDDAKTPEMMTVTWLATGISKVEISEDGNKWTEVPVSGTSVKRIASGYIKWTGTDEFCNGQKPFTTESGSGATVEITSSDLKPAIALVGTDKFDDLNKAVAAAADKTLKLLADATNLTIAANMTLDLNSRTMGGLSVDAGNVTVEDTNGAGKIDGSVFASDTDANLVFNGGKISTDSQYGNDKTTLDAYAKDGYQFVDKGEGYFVLELLPTTWEATIDLNVGTGITGPTAKVDGAGEDVDISTGKFDVPADSTLVVTYVAADGYDVTGNLVQTLSDEDGLRASVAPTAKIKTFDVTFEVEGAEPEVKKVNWGATVEAPADPVKAHATFDGWYNGQVKFDFATEIKEALTLTAKFIDDPKYTVTVTFDALQVENVKVNDTDYTGAVEVWSNDTVTVTATAKTGFKDVKFAWGDLQDQGACSFAIDANTEVTISAMADAKDPADDDPTDIDDKETAAERYGDSVPEELADVSAKALCSWAKGNGGLKTGDKIIENAFLLNCANDQTVVDAAEKAFKATSITVNSDGTVTVGEPGGYNGEIEKWGKVELDQEDWVKDQEGAKFFMLKLVPENLN